MSNKIVMASLMLALGLLLAGTELTGSFFYFSVSMYHSVMRTDVFLEPKVSTKRIQDMSKSRW